MKTRILVAGVVLGLMAVFPAAAEPPEPLEPAADRSHRVSRASKSGGTPARRARAGAATRVYRSHGTSRGRYYGRNYYRPSYYPYFGGYYGLYGYPFYYGYGLHPFAFRFGYYDSYGPYGRYRPPQVGTVDLNVTPKNAMVYVDGNLIGKAKKYDGFPQYLRLPRGTYELIFHKEGYETVRKTVEILPDVDIKLDLNMKSGEAKPVEEVSTPVQERRKEREELWRKYAKDRPTRKVETERKGADRSDLRDLPTRVQIKATPEDAVLYLDGKFLGTARGIAKRGGEITLDPGKHEIEVVRPGYQTKVIRFEGEKGEVLELDIKLEHEN